MSFASSPTELLLRRACAELVRELRAGHAVGAEDFLERFPEIASTEEAVVELVYTEFVTREELGQQPAAEEYGRRFPRWRDVIHEQLRIHTLFTSPAPAGKPSGLRETATAERRIGPYYLLEEVARGSMGVVYRARHGVLNRTVALKMVLAGAHAGEQQLARFRVEAEAIARLRHPNVVQVYEVGEHEGHPFIALEFVEGGSLAEQAGGRPITPTVAAALVERLSLAVEHAHAQGIVHRDLKPANVLFGRDGCPRITDFGLAKLLDQPGAQTETGVIFGTPSYMAPEQAAGHRAEVGPAADVYALGAILYELLTGTPPFRGETVLQTLQQVLSEEPIFADRLQPGVPRDLATVCMKCLHKQPAQRYPSARALAEDLRRFQEGKPILARRTGFMERSWKLARRRPLVTGLVAALTAMTAALFLGTLSYNAQLRASAEEADQQRAEARAAEQEAECRRLQAEASADEARRQAKMVRQKAEAQRRLVFTLQLARAEECCRSNPAHTLELLEDAERCPPDLRDFAWGLYHHLCKGHRLLKTAHREGIQALAFSPDGRTLALAGGGDRSVTLWDTEAGQPYVTLKGHQGAVRCLAFSPDGELLATGGDDGTIILWRVVSGVSQRILRGRWGSVRTLGFSADGKILASGNEDGSTVLWDADAGKRRAVWQGHPGGVTALSFSSDGRRLATGGADGAVRLWDPVTEGDRGRGQVLLAERGQVTSLAFSPDGKLLAAVGSARASIELLDGETLRARKSWRGHLDRVLALAFSPDGKFLASSGADRTVRLWEVESAVPCWVFQGQASATHALAFSPDGRVLATGDDGRVHLLQIEPRQLPTQAKEDPEASSRRQLVSLAFTPDGKTVITGGNDGRLHLWDAQTQIEQAGWHGHTGTVWSLALAADGRTLASGAEDRTVKLWDVPTRRLLATLSGYRARVRSVAFAPDGATLATSDEEGGVCLWDVVERSARRRLGREVGPTYSVGFSPDGKSLAAGTAAGKVVLWDLDTGRQRLATVHHRQAVLFAVFSPDGRTLATGGLDNRVKLWNVQDMRLRADLPWTAGYVFSAAFTPDGRTLAAGGGSRVGSHFPAEVALWDVATGHRRATLPRQSGPIAFSPQGHVLVTINDHIGLACWEADVSASGVASAPRGF